MKKLFSIILLVMFIALVITSCERDVNYIYIDDTAERDDVVPQGDDVQVDIAGATETIDSTSVQ